jgi:hypothetical protein
MKVKCIKTSVDKISIHIIIHDMNGYLSVGRLFDVYGIRFLKGVIYVYIFDDNHLFEVPIELFEVVIDKVSSEWVIKVWSNDEITLWPELFYQDDFLENFAEREFNERKMFESLRYTIESDS